MAYNLCGMKSYGQFCALAKALEVVGDRWTLLIVRELLIRGDARYTDLRNGLPGIATNLLVDRLGEMEKAGIIEKEQAPPPVATTLYRLTERGRDLRHVLAALGRWGAPLLAHAGKNDITCGHWLALPVKLFMRDRRPQDGPLTIGVELEDEKMVLHGQADGSFAVTMGRAAPHADLVLSGPPRGILGLLLHRITHAEAQKAGVRHEGNLKILQRLEHTFTPEGEVVTSK